MEGRARISGLGSIWCGVRFRNFGGFRDECKPFLGLRV